MPRELNDRQELFCCEYIKDFNASRSAKVAGYSQKTAGSKGHELLKNVEIQRRISELVKGRNERVQVDADYVLQRLVEIDQMDVADIIDDDGSIRPISQWPTVWRRTLSGIDVSEIYEGDGKKKALIGMMKKIKWPDKLRNLELLGKHVNVKAFEEDKSKDVTDLAQLISDLISGMPS